eukprot:m51a1_g4408 putative protein (327) ;mRNA; r:431640-432996
MASQSTAEFVADGSAVVFSCPTMRRLRDEILALPSSTGRYRAGEISWKKFEDGFPNLFIEDVAGMKGKEVILFIDLLDHTMLLSVLSVVYALPRYGAKSLKIILPYFPTGTMERVDLEGQIATAHSLARLLSHVPITQSGPTMLVIYDIHALQERFYFGDNIVPILLTATPLFVDVLKLYPRDHVALAFPDEGARKRFGVHFAGWDLVVCAKVRDGDRRIITISEGDPRGKHVFIVDDLVKTGGTLIECKDALFAHGAAKVSAYVTHAVFPQESWRRFTEPAEGATRFDKFYITNSCARTSETLRGKDPFVVLSLATCIPKALAYI